MSQSGRILLGLGFAFCRVCRNVREILQFHVAAAVLVVNANAGDVCFFDTRKCEIFAA